MQAVRKKRIESSIRRELGRLLVNFPRDPLFSRIAITDVSISPDLALARVFFSPFEGLEIEKVRDSLQREANFLRRLLAIELNLRNTPRLVFIYDETLQRSRTILALINQAVESDKKGELE